MNSTAYLLGAGASYYALPVVDEIRTAQNNEPRPLRSLESLIILLDEIKTSKTIGNLQAMFVHKTNESLKYLMQHLDEYPMQSIDTMMRKIYFANDTNYNRLKRIINIYFNIIEVTQEPDHRYDILLTNLLSNSGNFPKNIIFLNWNYDRQLRFTYSLLKSHRINPVFHFMNQSDYKSTSGIKEVKLNGAFGPIHDEILSRFKPKTDKISTFLVSTIFRPSNAYQKYISTDEKYDSIQFSWENKFANDELLNDLKEVSKLVVIGYSFPHFNRENDIKLLKSMAMKTGGILNVIIQDTNPQKIESILRNISSSEGMQLVVSFEDPSVFHIPQNIEYGK